MCTLCDEKCEGLALPSVLALVLPGWVTLNHSGPRNPHLHSSREQTARLRGRLRGVDDWGLPRG